MQRSDQTHSKKNLKGQADDGITLRHWTSTARTEIKLQFKNIFIYNQQLLTSCHKTACFHLPLPERSIEKQQKFQTFNVTLMKGDSNVAFMLTLIRYKTRVTVYLDKQTQPKPKPYAISYTLATFHIHLKLFVSFQIASTSKQHTFPSASTLSITLANEQVVLASYWLFKCSHYGSQIVLQKL